MTSYVDSRPTYQTPRRRVQLYRGIQYFARFFAWLLLSRGYKIQAARWDALKSHLALGRKRKSRSVCTTRDYCANQRLVLRLGKFAENAQAVLKALHAPGEAGERITTIGRQIGYFGYLFLDQLVWVRLSYVPSSPADGDYRFARV